jgi:hypothetical protein
MLFSPELQKLMPDITDLRPGPTLSAPLAKISTPQ